MGFGLVTIFAWGRRPHPDDQWDERLAPAVAATLLYVYSKALGVGILQLKNFIPLTGSQLTAALNGLCTSWADLWAFYSSGGGTQTAVLPELLLMSWIHR